MGFKVIFFPINSKPFYLIHNLQRLRWVDLKEKEQLIQFEAVMML